MFVVVTFVALLASAGMAWMVYFCVEARPERRHCIYCNRMTNWRPDIGCELCNGSDIS